MERDKLGNGAKLNIGISTHTLTWSVTYNCVVFVDENGISTHTLTWSVTTTATLTAVRLLISTHTLTWSVTDPISRMRTDHEDFNSHAHVERDVYIETLQSIFPNFNSHAHVERDVLPLSTLRALQISTHTLTWSVTLLPVLVVIRTAISTHTLTWSVTLSPAHSTNL